MKKIIIIFILVISVFSIYADNETSIYGYSSTITEPFSTNIYGESLSNQGMMLMSLPDNPGEPIPDPETTPLGDTPIFMLFVFIFFYTLYISKKRKRNKK